MGVFFPSELRYALYMRHPQTSGSFIFTITVFTITVASGAIALSAAGCGNQGSKNQNETVPVSPSGTGVTPTATPTPNDTTSDTPTAEPADPCANAVVCDDFEQHNAGGAPSAPWDVSTNSGSVAVSTERAFSGNQSIHCQAEAGSYAQAFITLAGAPAFPSLGAELYGRVMIWAAATPEGSVHWSFVAADGPTSDGDRAYYRVGGQHDGALMNNYWTDDAQKDCWDHSRTTLPIQTWVCLEWRFATATNEIQVWLDGKELTDLHMTGAGEGCVGEPEDVSWPAPTAFEKLGLGWTHYQNTSQKDVWLDDVAFGNQRVGCPQ